MAQTYSDVQQRRNFQNMIPVVQEVVVDFSYEVEYQIICAFQASFSFILALQMNTWLNIILDEKRFDATQFALIFLILIPAVVILSYVKKRFADSYRNGKT
jgi:hypothetical protein